MAWLVFRSFPKLIRFGATGRRFPVVQETEHQWRCSAVMITSKINGFGRNRMSRDLGKAMTRMTRSPSRTRFREPETCATTSKGYLKILDLNTNRSPTKILPSR